MIKEVDFNIFDNVEKAYQKDKNKIVKENNEDVKSTSNWIFDNKSDIQSVYFRNFRDQVIDLDDDGSFIDLQIIKKGMPVPENKYANLFKLTKHDGD